VELSKDIDCNGGDVEEEGVSIDKKIIGRLFVEL
jgi:hypothetical protein